MKNRFILFIIVLLILSSFNNEENSNGRKLFIANCAMCHRPDRPVVGPPFQKIREDYDLNRIYSMIRNHDSFMRNSDVRARYLYVVWNKSTFKKTYHFLSDTDINNILDYVDTVKPYNPQYYAHRKLSEKEMNRNLHKYEQILKNSGPFAASDYLDSLKKH